MEVTARFEIVVDLLWVSHVRLVITLATPRFVGDSLDGHVLRMDFNFRVVALVQHKSDHAMQWIQQFIQVYALGTDDVDVL